MEIFKLAVVGSREFNNYPLLEKKLNIYKNQISLIISGGAKGADLLAERYALENNIPTMIFKPNWKRYGKPAGMIRNKKIVDNADKVIAFWNNKSRGTLNTINLATEQDKLLSVVHF